MAVRVRLHPRELADEAEVLRFANGVKWVIHEDNTLEILDDDDGTVAHIHPDRWDSVNLVTHRQEA